MAQPSSELLARYLAGTCTENEKRQVEVWYDSFEQNPTLFEAHPNTEKPVYQQGLYARLQAAIRAGETPVIPLLPSRLWGRWAVAASVAMAILVGGWWLWQQQAGQQSLANVTEPSEQFALTATITVENREPKIVSQRLSDGTTIWLNPGAKLTHPRQFSGSTRSITFTGEGFFDVHHDPAHPFVIQSGRMTTQVLGTSFNLRANPQQEQYQVTVVTGKVAVKLQKTATEPAKQVVLTPRQEVVWTATEPELTRQSVAETPRQPLYQPTSIAFDWAPLSEVAERLEAVYNVRLVLANPALRHCKLRADFTNERLPVILELIGRSVNADYRIDGNTITLTGEGCPE